MSDNTKKVQILQRAFGKGELSRDSSDITLACPGCKKSGKAKRKLSVRLDDGLFHCWVCGLKGQNIEYLFKKYAPGLLDDARAARFGKHDINHIGSIGDPEEHQDDSVEVPEGFILLASSVEKQDPDVKDTIKYCYDRGLKLKDLWYFKLGTCKHGKYRRRVIFPSFDEEGNINYFTARSIDGSDKMKYINAKVAKKTIIFNELNIDWKKELTLVEGPFDLTKSTQNTACLLGSHLSSDSELFRKIVTNRTPVLLALDPDAKQKSHNIAKTLYSYDINVRSVEVPSGRDVGDMTKKEFEDLTKTATGWNQKDRLLHMISNIKSGSIL